jgi:acetyl-CoA carboxylase biotin carboxyl carrier protein
MAAQVEARIAGSVWKIEKAVGEIVDEGELIRIIESMKMESPVEAPCSERVAELCVDAGDAIEEGAILALIE